MRLSTVLYLFVGLIVSMAVALAGSIYVNQRVHDQVAHQLAASQAIKSIVVHLSTLGAEFSINHRNRSAVQWLNQQRALDQLLVSLRENPAIQADTLDQMALLSQQLHDSFTRLQTSVSDSYPASPAAQQQAVRLFTGQLLYQLQSLSSYTEQQVQESLTQTQQSFQSGVLLSTVATTLVLAGLAATVLIVYLSVIRPGQELRQAIATIRDGGLTFRLAENGLYEFREIGREFNQMLDHVQRVNEAQQIASFGDWEWDIQSDEIIWSDGVFRLFGFQPQSFVPTYEAFLEMIHPDDRTSVELAVGTALEHNNTYAVEHRIVLPDGTEKIVKEQGKVIRDAAENPVRMIGTVLDITLEHRARVALQTSETLYKQMFEMNSAMKLLINPKTGEIISANDSACEFYGYSREQFSQLSIFDINLLSKAQIAEEMACAAREQRRFFRFKHRLASGEVRDVEVHSGPVVVEGQSLLHSIIIDVSDRNRYEAELARVSERLKQSETRNELAQQLYGIGVWQWDADSGEVFWSQEMYDIWGVAVESFSCDFEAVAEIVHPDDRQAWQDDVERACHEGVNHELEFRIILPDGGIKWIYALGKPQLEQGALKGMFGICTDVTERRNQRIRLTRAASVFANAQEGIIITDPGGVIVETNQAFTDITGFSDDEVIGQTPRILKSGRHNDAFYDAMWRTLLDTDHWQGELWNKTQQGEFFAENLTISAVRDSDGRLTNFVGVFSDITVKKLREETLEKKANFDPLTDLPNRRVLSAALALKAGKRLASGLAVLFIDLDGFKAINDTFGHATGDELLVAVSKRIKAQLRPDDIVSRVGGDEFIVLADRLSSEEEVGKLGQRILNACSDLFVFDGADVQMSASIGATFCPQNSLILSASALISRADEAMYAAKGQGKGQVVLLDSQSESH